MATCIANSLTSVVALSQNVTAIEKLRTSQAMCFRPASSTFRKLAASKTIRSETIKKRLVCASAATEVEVDVASLDSSFGAQGVHIDVGEGGLTRVILTNSAGSVAEVYLYGAVATSWKIPSGQDLLFVRPDAVFTGKKPISGGIPHCFPQFGPGVMQQHGFARNSTWDISSTEGGESPSVTLKLVDNEYTRGMWDFAFEALFKITLGGESLSTELSVTNTDSKPFEFTTALHSYFSAKVSGAKVSGLKGLTYLDKEKDPSNPIKAEETREEVTFPGFVDCVYLKAPSELVLDNGEGKTIAISSKGWSDAVLWNPHLTMEACYKDFVCVENAQMDPVSLQPGATWVASQVLTPK